MTSPTLIFFCPPQNKNTLCALAGALDTEPELSGWRLLRAANAAEFQAALQTASGAKPLVAAFTFFTFQAKEACGLAAAAKATAGGKVLLAAGGVHASARPREMLERGFDAVISGEGEATFPALLKTLACGGDWRALPGISHLEGGRLVSNAPPPAVDLDKYPPVSFPRDIFGAVEITRGCPNACKFCRTSGYFGAKMRHRGAEAVLAASAALAARGLTHFRAITPDAFAYGSPDGRALNLPALENLLAGLSGALHPGGGKVFFGSFPSEVRPEHVTAETIALVRRFCDNDNIVIGAQTASPSLLAACGRGHTPEDFMRAAEITVRAGLKANVDFIFGLPGETEADAAASARCMEELARMGARIHAHTFMPLPGTAFENERPSPSLDCYEPVIRKLNGTGALFGDWINQRSICNKGV
ncbi:MAG: TIGR04013 family B12-binding domain/radical SAM domain-containing protein [Elusimicrobiales bacterium]